MVWGMMMLGNVSARVANPLITVPASPPATAYGLVDAFTTNPGFDQPLALASPPGELRKLFICEKSGKLRVIADVTVANPVPTTVLNLATYLSARSQTFVPDGEQGLLSVAFHPNYASNRFFYVFYSVNAARPGTATFVNFERVSRFTMQAANPLLADLTSELVLLQQEDEASNHQGGSLNFGPDGYLYISVGDEGGANDNYNNSQVIDGDFFSGMLRIDVDKKPGNLNPSNHPGVLRDAGVARYAVPADNAWVGATSFNGVAVSAATLRTEFWAVGLRNPWRTSFDSATGELWCADVGQNAYEEIDVLTSGGNYGWAYREGLHAGPKSAPGGFTSIDPIYEYNHTNLAGDPNFKGNSVTGGVVYRGTRFASLIGAYVFADYGSGNVWSLRRNAGAAPTVVRLTGEGGLVAFGVDPSNGDVLTCDLSDGVLRRLTVPDTTGTTFPQTLTATKLFSSVPNLTPAASVVEYAVNVPFWSDYAVKRRWFTIPDGVSRMTSAPQGAWTFPNGTIWVKHFDLDLTRGNSATRQRIETRLLVKNATGAYGVSYRWNVAQTEATLVPDGGADIPYTVVENGTSRTQNWRIPSRAECLICHNATAGRSLSFNTRQLNLDGLPGGLSGNQLTQLEAQAYLTNTLGSPNLLPRHVRSTETNYSLESRVRSYLDVNCAYCHQPGGPSLPAAWDARVTQTLAQTGLIHGIPVNNGGNATYQLIVPGVSAQSVIRHRIAATGGFSRMPPLATNELDSTNLTMLTDWINLTLPNLQTYDQWRTLYFGNLTNPAGAPGVDAEGDGATNYAEYLAQTHPLQGTSRLRLTPVLSANGTLLTLSFPIPENRSFRIESTNNFTTWQPLDLPGNDTIPRPAGLLQFPIPRTQARNFFRLRLSEN